MEKGKSGRKKSVTLPVDYLTLEQVVAEVEKDYIHKTLRMTDWNLQLASRVLGVARNTLKAKVQKYGVKV
jgi:DNA-binding NtrC family response regulator